MREAVRRILACARAAVTLLIAATSFVALVATAQGAGDDPGRRTYLRYCASCHGAAAKGDGPMVKHLVQPPADLTTLAKRHGGVFPSLRVADSIDGRGAPRSGPHGPREMPVWGTVFRQGDPGSAPPRNPERRARQNMVDLLEYLARIQEH